MGDIYDESGTVVATHPVQAAQHDVNTNNAPEQNILPMNIDLPSHDVLARKKAKGLKFTPIEMFIWCCEPGEGESSTFRSALSRLLAAMQPQVSESDETSQSLVRALESALQNNGAYEDDVVYHHFDALRQHISKHRHPAAVSADAVRMREVIDTAVRVLTVYASPNTYEEEREANSNVFRSWIKDDKGNAARQAVKVINAALSPETVCGGEK